MFRWFFFFKQKTAYEMRISDWSSDVCSSDLLAVGQDAVVQHGGDDALALDPLDLQLHQAVVEQQDVAGVDVARQAEVADADLAFVAGRRVGDRKSVVSGKSGSVSVDIGGRRIL